MATSAPFSAKARAIAAPRPRAPPVTSIVLPAKVWAILISRDSISPRRPKRDRRLTDVITNNMLPIGTVSMVVRSGPSVKNMLLYISIGIVWRGAGVGARQAVDGKTA